MKRLLLLIGLLFWSCEDDRVEDLKENIQMFVNGIIIFENLEVGTDPEATFYQGVY
jgi:hypothetical protein